MTYKNTNSCTKAIFAKEKEVVEMADEMLVVTSKVRAYLKEQGAMMSGELPEALNAKVKSMLQEAAKRARGNKRSTVKPQDV